MIQQVDVDGAERPRLLDGFRWRPGVEQRGTNMAALRRLAVELLEPCGNPTRCIRRAIERDPDGGHLDAAPSIAMDRDPTLSPPSSDPAAEGGHLEHLTEHDRADDVDHRAASHPVNVQGQATVGAVIASDILDVPRRSVEAEPTVAGHGVDSHPLRHGELPADPRVGNQRIGFVEIRLTGTSGHGYLIRTACFRLH